MGSPARQRRQQLGLAIATAVCVLLSATVASSTPDTLRLEPAEPEFRLARLAYGDNGMGFGGGGFGRGRGGDSWTTDAPEAEFHLTQGIRRLTRIDTPNPGKYADWDFVFPVRPGGPEDGDYNPHDLYDYPFVYGVEVGRWYLSDKEAEHMRQYLLRGGFMMVDDFHGLDQWQGFVESMQRVFPDREIIEIPDDHEVFHVLYDLDHKTQIPGRAALMNGSTCEQCSYGGAEPHWRGIFDDKGRLMVVINFNMDLGDAWEHADAPEYPQPLTALAYRFAISYALYAMSH